MALIAGKITEKFPIPVTDIDAESIKQKKSLAYAIEKAFMDTWAEAMGGQPNPEHNKQMQLLFVAIAEGVVNHLKNNPLSITIENTNIDINRTLTGTFYIDKI